MVDVSVIILTLNEEKHLERCVRSLLPFTDKIYIVDSFSTDRTVEIAKSLGCAVLQNAWVSYAFQYNLGIQTNPFKTGWVMRMDADEYVLPELADEINRELPGLPADVGGVYVKRRVLFMDKWIKRGGYYPTWLLRLWRNGHGVCEESWMDEHIKIDAGRVVHFQRDLVDHNLNNLTWWTNKHNNYSIREVIDLLCIRYGFGKRRSIVEPKLFGAQDQRRRYLKQLYASAPLFTRPFAYFVLRYFFKLGFLDGRPGLIWHCLQGLWYRFLVDAKLHEIHHRAGTDPDAIRDYIKREYGKDVDAF